MAGIGRAFLAQAKNALLECCGPAAVHALPPDQAVGRVVAAPLVATSGRPESPIALIDGWALASAETIGASIYLPALIDSPILVRAGKALPAGADAVLPVDGLVREQGLAAVQIPLLPGENVRRSGRDIAVGAILAEPGSRLGLAAAAAAALAGIDTVMVREPHVCLPRLPGPGPELAARIATDWLTARGVRCRNFVLGDMNGPLAERTDDLVVVIGDAAVALDDSLVEMMERRGHVTAHGLAMRPGETIATGEIDGCAALIVPHRLEAVLAALLLLVRPIVSALEGAAREPPTLTRPLTRKIVSTIGMSELALFSLADDGRALRPLCVGDIDWTSCAVADYFAEIPPESEGRDQGEMFDALPIR